MKIRVKIAYIMYYIIGRKLPSSYFPIIGIFFNKIRKVLVKNFIKSMGENVTINRMAKISRHVTLGDFSGIGENCLVSSGTKIGNYVMMGPDVKIFSVNHKMDSVDTPMCFQGETNVNSVEIADDVWIGANVIILPGIKIGTGVVIGAGAVVTKSVDDFAVVGGNPAKVIRYRN